MTTGQTFSPARLMTARRMGFQESMRVPGRRVWKWYLSRKSSIGGSFPRLVKYLHGTTLEISGGWSGLSCDGGRTVFEDDKDRFAWVDLMERACGRFGWRVHAWVLTGNHFHVLVETPEPNLVAGMKWMLGVFSPGWNRRRQRHGHIFQGRYKAVVVNGEERDGSYFKIVADYSHLNPVRSGWVGGETGKSLRSWRWSSFPAYAGGKVPDLLVMDRVLRAFQLSEDRRGGKACGGYLEARAKIAGSAVNDASLAELRRGWYLGEKIFGEKVLAALSGRNLPVRKKSSLGGEAAKAFDQAEAERIVVAGLAGLGLPGEPALLLGRGK